MNFYSIFEFQITSFCPCIYSSELFSINFVEFNGPNERLGIQSTTMYTIIALFSSSNYQLTNLFFSKYYFILKVGGHSSMFQYDKNTVCKVLEIPELDFYQSMPHPLKKFTPEFRGKISFLEFSSSCFC
jgi:hypothetical protein